MDIYSQNRMPLNADPKPLKFILRLRMTKVDYIPEGIIADILSKLPSKSALRFKTASKTWYSLISDPLFINLHCKQASQNPKILLSTIGPDSYSQVQVQILDYESQLFDDSCLSGPINVPEKLSFNWIPIGSSCGLVCVTDDSWETFSIWNPSTRECRKISNLDMNLVEEVQFGYDDGEPRWFWGFGYDLVTSDFNIVISTDTFRFTIFSMKSNSWKTITCPLGSEYYRWDSLSFGSFVLNGIFHWVVDTILSGLEILAFNAANETFEKLQLPVDRSWNSTGSPLAYLFEHRGCLCVSLLKPDEAYLCKDRQIWMKKEYGGWIHLFTIAIKHPLHQLRCLWVSTRNEVISHGLREFIRSRRENNNLDEIRMQNVVNAAVLYVETLVSPNAVK